MSKGNREIKKPKKVKIEPATPQPVLASPNKGKAAAANGSKNKG